MHYFCKKLLKKGDNVLDIGANFGHYSIIFAKKIGTHGKVFAVEPIKEYCKMIEYNKNIFNIKNIEIFNFGFAKNRQKLFFGLPKDTPYRYGYTKIISEKKTKDKNIMILGKCCMRRPGDILNKLKNINYIKCDVEGYEDKIVPLMLDYLNEKRPILQIEISGKNCVLIKKLLESIKYTPCTLNKNNLLNISQKNIEDYCHEDFIFMPNEDYELLIK